MKMIQRLDDGMTRKNMVRGRGGTYKFADRMLEPGMRDEEQKKRKFRKQVVGGGDLKGGRRRGGGVQCQWLVL